MHEIKCGDVNGKGTKCVFWNKDKSRCGNGQLANSATLCFCSELRNSNLLEQLETNIEQLESVVAAARQEDCGWPWSCKSCQGYYCADKEELHTALRVLDGKDND